VDLGEFKLALRALRTAGQFVMPWNYSFLALEGFLLQSNFCKNELIGDDRLFALKGQRISQTSMGLPKDWGIVVNWL
jgi:hypothetical protein